MITVLAEPGMLEAGRDLRLAEMEAHHLRVRRAREGEEVRLLDGAGQVAHGLVLGDPGEGRVQVMRSEALPAPPSLILAVGGGDRERFAWLVEKAAELGVTDILPLETERTAGVGTRVRAEHTEKLQRRALEAIKQSGAAWAPRVHPPVAVGDLTAWPGAETRWLADAEGMLPSPAEPSTPLLVVIGPEGGLTPEERQNLIDAGFQLVRMGPHTLRFETAALAAAVIGGSLRREPPHG